MELEKVNLKEGPIPEDYHCSCDFCKEFKGVLIRENGTFYSKLDRRQYYDTGAEKAHIAKTPLHVARWAIQQYSKEGDWVLDPTMGAGTTAVEALMQKRNAAGVEIQFIEVIRANVKKCNPYEMSCHVYEGDARDLLDYFDHSFDLVINNPPYSGDESQRFYGVGSKYAYDHSINKNLALMKETPAYWRDIQDIYLQARLLLKPGGRFVIGVKDMIRNKTPYLLHKYYGEVLEKINLSYEGMVLLPHYPPTMFMSTYPKRFPNAKVPRYQTILVFKKE